MLESHFLWDGVDTRLAPLNETRDGYYGRVVAARKAAEQTLLGGNNRFMGAGLEEDHWDAGAVVRGQAVQVIGNVSVSEDSEYATASDRIPSEPDEGPNIQSGLLGAVDRANVAVDLARDGASAVGTSVVSNLEQGLPTVLTKTVPVQAAFAAAEIGDLVVKQLIQTGKDVEELIDRRLRKNKPQGNRKVDSGDNVSEKEAVGGSVKEEKREFKEESPDAPQRQADVPPRGQDLTLLGPMGQGSLVKRGAVVGNALMRGMRQGILAPRRGRKGSGQNIVPLFPHFNNRKKPHKPSLRGDRH